MAGQLQSEIQQTKPFESLEEEALLNIARTADQTAQVVSNLLKPFGLSGTQYNVLRILRGAGESGHACSEIGRRMVAHDPDVTRLLDRLEARGFVVRQRDLKDRRVIIARITPAGLGLLDQLDEPIREGSQRTIGHLGEEKLRMLIDLLELIRSGGI